jgi:hypothetical protein
VCKELYGDDIPREDEKCYGKIYNHILKKEKENFNYSKYNTIYIQSYISILFLANHIHCDPTREQFSKFILLYEMN